MIIQHSLKTKLNAN